MKGTSGIHCIQEVTTVSGIKMSRGHCPFSKPPPCPCHTQSQEAGALSETPLTWLTLFDPPWRSPETLPHPTHGPTQAAFPYEWLVLAHASQLPKSFLTRNSQSSESLRTGTSSSQPRFTVWLCLGISKPNTNSSHFRYVR